MRLQIILNHIRILVQMADIYFFGRLKLCVTRLASGKFCRFSFFVIQTFTLMQNYTQIVCILKRGRIGLPLREKKKQFRAGNARQILSDPDPDLHTLNWDSVLYLVGKRTKAMTPI